MRRIHDFPTVGEMELIIMVLVPFPLGRFVRNRTAAFVGYIAIHAFVFTFQTAGLVLEWANGSTAAFGPFPTFDNVALFGYGLVNLVIYAVGLGLVTLGCRVGSKSGLHRRDAELVSLPMTEQPPIPANSSNPDRSTT